MRYCEDFVASYSLKVIFTNIFQCVPVQSNRDESVTKHCINLDVELVVVSSINVLIDATIRVLPMPYIWRLKIDTRRKVQLTCIFLLTILFVVVSIARITYVENASYTDGFWADPYAAMWSVVENRATILAACLPVMRPVINQIIYGSHNASRNARRADGNEGKFGPLDDRHIVTTL